ncbi:hypothetical protein ColLi_10983 [Colletotrichum liriopes]|uniref:Uncharacterized protein n=1 Tax=Colletotrichum liriopes TaxID=708192 RepID=A0AA37GVP2_9PEZI|nr:hypothetical protein ColLi_10983 [Colletotrichum liriopes]
MPGAINRLNMHMVISAAPRPYRRPQQPRLVAFGSVSVNNGMPRDPCRRQTAGAADAGCVAGQPADFDRNGENPSIKHSNHSFIDEPKVEILLEQEETGSCPTVHFIDSLLATWAKDPDNSANTREDDGAVASFSSVATVQEKFDHFNRLMLEQYTEMRDHSPVPTLHFAAKLVNETQHYLDSTHLKMHNQSVYQEGGYHKWAADALEGWACPIEASLDMAASFNDSLARKEDEYLKDMPWDNTAPPSTRSQSSGNTYGAWLMN